MTTAEAPANGGGDGVDPIAGYEQLRREVIGPAAEHRQGLALVVLIRQGLTAWTKALRAPGPARIPASQAPPLRPGRIDSNWTCQAATILVAMALARFQEG